MKPTKSELFDKSSLWKILQYFALNPNTEIYVNRLSKEIDLSPGICSISLRQLEAIGLLERIELGRAHYYRLKKDYVTNGLKRFITLFQLSEMGVVERILEVSPEVSTILLYGSYGLGDFNETSDIDILVMSSNRKWDLADIEDRYEVTINIRSFSIGQWLKMKEDDDPFYNSVVNNHVILHGSELI